MSDSAALDETTGATEAITLFEREIGAEGVPTERSSVGNSNFLKFVVGAEAPFYLHAIRETQKSLSSGNPYQGSLGLVTKRADKFPASLEATSLLTLLTRATRAVSQDTSERGFTVPYVPFQNREDHLLAQPATHVVVGRRGVGKSTLIQRAVASLRTAGKATVAVVDSQAYATLSGDALAKEFLYDIGIALLNDIKRSHVVIPRNMNTTEFQALLDNILNGQILPRDAIPRIKRQISAITETTGNHVFVFLDDFHLIDPKEQPAFLHLIHGALKGANGWLKVAGIRSLLNYYSPTSKEGLQVPGDAQLISLDLTLENPEAAEAHLRAILNGFIKAIGYGGLRDILPEAAFHRLVWANAGVPRDFLQMFARSIEHARRNKHSVVTVSDVNVAIGEFGQRKIDELSQDARNEEGALRSMLGALEKYCLDTNQTNGFLLRSEESKEYILTLTLSDLRLVHLISQSTTPDTAGEKYQAFILDYSLFTGFRRRPNITEMIPEQEQFKAAELRKLPKVSSGFLASKQE